MTFFKKELDIYKTNAGTALHKLAHTYRGFLGSTKSGSQIYVAVEVPYVLLKFHLSPM